jgi:1,4-dihydroxy-2-naphthoate octaprenyltransferase
VARLGAFLLLSRPHFLLGGVVLFALGALPAVEIDLTAYLWGQLMVTSTQLVAHYANEYADFEADRLVEHRTVFSGGSGVLVSGGLTPAVALRAAVVASGVALVGVVVFAFRSPLVAVLGLAALGVSWAYSVEPLRLLGTGSGEVVTSLVVGGVLPVVGASTQGLALRADLWWSIAVLVPAHIGMMIAFELPDLDSDRRAGKRVLAVRLGPAAATAVMLGAWGLAVGLLLVAPIAAVPAVAAPAVAVLAALSLFATHRHAFNLATVAAVGVLVVTSLLLLMARIG